jgi:hypothetical protein
VQKTDLVGGVVYAVRQARQARGDTSFSKVSYIGPCRDRQARIRYETGDLNGLVEWLPTRLIVCRWTERKAFQKDEERAAKLSASDAEVWDPVYEEAISAVMTASGEYGGFQKSWTTDSASAERFWSRAGLSGSPLEHDRVNFVNRNGQWHVSFATATRACQAFAAAEPDLVDLYLRDWEDRLRAEGFEPGNRHSHELLRKWAPALLWRVPGAGSRSALRRNKRWNGCSASCGRRCVRWKLPVMIEEPGVSRVGSAAHRYAGLPVRSGTSTVRRPRESSKTASGLLDRLQHNHAG